MKQLRESVWEVRQSNEDGTRDAHVAYFTTRAGAEAITGNDHWKSIRPVDLNVTIYETVTEYKKDVLDSKRAAALAKLTDEEKEILGIKA